jgi:hypothetical protein
MYSNFSNSLRDREKWRAFINALMNLRFAINFGEYHDYLSDY